MPVLTVCARHQRFVPAGEKCPLCTSERAQHEHVRRSANNARLGRTSKHWMRLSARLRRAAKGICLECGGAESPDYPASKLTVDLVGGGDHRTAREEDCRVACRSCHGRRDGAQR